MPHSAVELIDGSLLSYLIRNDSASTMTDQHTLVTFIHLHAFALR